MPQHLADEQNVLARVEDRGYRNPLSSARPQTAPAPNMKYELLSTPVGTEDGRVIFAQVSFNSGLRKEFVTSLKKYLEYLETTLQ